MDTSNVQPGNGSTSGIQRKEPVGLAVEHAPAVSMRPGQLAGFDQHHPPDPELIADCVHCGFCLPTCPTYLLWGQAFAALSGIKPTHTGSIVGYGGGDASCEPGGAALSTGYIHASSGDAATTSGAAAGLCAACVL